MATDQDGFKVPPEIAERAIKSFLQENITARTLLLDSAVAQARQQFLEELATERNAIQSRKDAHSDFTSGARDKFQAGQSALNSAVLEVTGAALKAKQEVEAQKGLLAAAIVKFDTDVRKELNDQKTELEKRFNRYVIPAGLVLVALMAFGSLWLFNKSVEDVQKKYEKANEGVTVLQTNLVRDQTTLKNLEEDLKAAQPKIAAIQASAPEIGATMKNYQDRIIALEAWRAAEADKAASAAASTKLRAQNASNSASGGSQSKAKP